jgi:hypothetical protein
MNRAGVSIANSAASRRAVAFGAIAAFTASRVLLALLERNPRIVEDTLGR